MIKNIKLTISYDGTNYFGWQTQPHKTTIQEVIEESIFKIMNEKIVLNASGRTDAGVHAIGQVANFKVDTNIEEHKIKLALNSILPKDIRIINSEYVDLDFHSRYSAKKKTYMYQIYNTKINSPFYDRYTYFVPYELCVEKMREALKYIEGVHDFKPFMSSGSNVENTVREIYNAKLDTDGNLMKIYITGNGFLYNMVRIIVGTLVDIGRGKKDIKCIEDAFIKYDRNCLGHTAKPEGLFLKEVFYF